MLQLLRKKMMMRFALPLKLLWQHVSNFCCRFLDDQLYPARTFTFENNLSAVLYFPQWQVCDIVSMCGKKKKKMSLVYQTLHIWIHTCDEKCKCPLFFWSIHPYSCLRTSIIRLPFIDFWGGIVLFFWGCTSIFRGNTSRMMLLNTSLKSTNSQDPCTWP